jgi:hypothetical protein
MRFARVDGALMRLPDGKIYLELRDMAGRPNMVALDSVSKARV